MVQYLEDVKESFLSDTFDIEGEGEGSYCPPFGPDQEGRDFPTTTGTVVVCVTNTGTRLREGLRQKGVPNRLRSQNYS